jgi:hypothetical protein
MGVDVDKILRQLGVSDNHTRYRDAEGRITVIDGERPDYGTLEIDPAYLERLAQAKTVEERYAVMKTHPLLDEPLARMLAELGAGWSQ